MIEYLRSRAALTVLRYYRETSHPHVELLPRARVGLHAIARTCLVPGDRVLISPVTCHTVIEALLQAGVVPLFVDIDPRDGNIDISRLGPRALRRAKAILTTNLYGNPDDAQEIAALARRHRLLLIEDCAHVFDTTVGGKRVGGIGDFSVFSFKKFFGVPGGVLTGKNATQVEKVGEWLHRACRRPSGARELAGWARGKARRGAAGKLLEMRRRFVSRNDARPEGTAPEDGVGIPGSLTLATGSGIADYLELPLLDELQRAAVCLDHPERFREELERGNRELIRGVPLEYLKSPYPATVVHMAVPFSCPDRDSLLARLRGSGIPLWFLYNPPMNFRYSSSIPVDSSLDLDRLEEWRRRILPLPGRHAGRILSEFRHSDTAPKTAGNVSSRDGS